jgi:hypothetical protein
VGFRNPVRTAVDQLARDKADQALDAALHGIIPGSRLAADAIDGRTITGAVVRTASAGQRTEIRRDGDVGKVLAYTGREATESPGGMFATGSSLGRFLYLNTPTDAGVNNVPGPYLMLAVREATGGGYRAEATVGNAAITYLANIVQVAGGDVRLTEQGFRADNVARRDYVDSTVDAVAHSLYAEASPPYLTGWAAAAITGYANLRFALQRDGMVTVSGACRYSAVTGATLTICGLTGNYVPRDGAVVIEGNAQGDVPRKLTVSADGLTLRGAALSNGQWLVVSGTYPGASA